MLVRSFVLTDQPSSVRLKVVRPGEHAVDVLSDVLSAVRLSGAVFFDVDASSPWCGASPGVERIAPRVMPDAERVIAFHAVLSGSCWTWLENGPEAPFRVDSGDVLVVPSGAPHVMASSPELRSNPDLTLYYRPVDAHLPFSLTVNGGGGDRHAVDAGERPPFSLISHGGGGEERTRYICGFVGCDVRPFNPLLASLPALMCVRKPAAGGWVTDLFRHALAEGSTKRPGGETVLAKLSELMFVEVLRRHIEGLTEASRGWLSGLRDPHVGEALSLIHGRPTDSWTLDGLAQKVGLSRTAFATRFTEFVEVPPMQYVARWRLQLAARLIERGVSLADACVEVGYESEAAFNRAFKKFVGVPPGAWRKRHQPPTGRQDG
jgi:AraC-like DNA-binding protein/mannose-6-phosphate isomerase-like protein (cupin superfamily)